MNVTAMVRLSILLGVACHVVMVPARADAHPKFGPETLVQAAGGDIEVPGFSVPSFDFWDGDELRDLIVGEGGGDEGDGRVRVYLNVGALDDPI
jgi:hypothetical protein